MSALRIPGSFRDPAGFVFLRDEQVFRQINLAGKEDFALLINSGLYEKLAKTGDLVQHHEGDFPPAETMNHWKVIRPETVPFVSYTFEWCFSQWQQAALLTLRIQRVALEYGMTLKDASAYNVQFRGSRPVFIDTLSFSKYSPGEPWAAYGQFCRHFLAPLLLMSYRDVRLGALMAAHIDGIPLDLASSLLPRRTWFRFSVLTHLHLHAKAVKRQPQTAEVRTKYKVSQQAQLALLENLETLVRRLRWLPRGTEWADYTDEHNYTPVALEHKKSVVQGFVSERKPASLWDIGANTGVFSRLASGQGILTVASDSDAAAVEKNYLCCVEEGNKSLLPLIADVTNLSPGIGWANSERAPLTERIRAEMIFALALVHHLAIAHRLPFDHIARFFAEHCRYLVIEFVPKEDSQVVRMLSTRGDSFPDYTRENFEAAFGAFFHLKEKIVLKDSIRILYLMTREVSPAK